MQRETQIKRPVATKGNELSTQKLRDFINKVDEAQRCFNQQGLNYNLTTICTMVAARPAPRFYVDAQSALLQYRYYLQGRSNIHSDTNRRMYAEIFARYEHLLQTAKASGQKIIKKQLMKRVLEQEAPCFYYEDNSAIKMYYRVLQRKRRKQL